MKIKWGLYIGRAKDYPMYWSIRSIFGRQRNVHRAIRVKVMEVFNARH